MFDFFFFFLLVELKIFRDNEQPPKKKIKISIFFEVVLVIETIYNSQYNLDEKAILTMRKATFHEKPDQYLFTPTTPVT